MDELEALRAENRDLKRRLRLLDPEVQKARTADIFRRYKFGKRGLAGQSASELAAEYGITPARVVDIANKQRRKAERRQYLADQEEYRKLDLEIRQAKLPVKHSYTESQVREGEDL